MKMKTKKLTRTRMVILIRSDERLVEIGLWFDGGYVGLERERVG